MKIHTKENILCINLVINKMFVSLYQITIKTLKNEIRENY